MTERKPNQPRDWRRILLEADWWRLVQLPLLAGSFAVAFWVSFTQQRQLGVDVGWDKPWGLPVILDLVYVATLIDYMRKPRVFNTVASIVLVIVTSIGNILALLYDPASRHLPAPIEVAGAWKVVAPLGMFVIAHYYANARKETTNVVRAAVDQSIGGDTGDRDTAAGDGIGVGVDRGRAGQDRESHPPMAVAPKKPARIPAHRNPPARRGTRTDEELAQTVRLERWQTLSGDELAERLHVAKGRALRVRALSVSDGNGKVAADTMSN